MTPAPFLRDRAYAVAERLAETADAIRRGIALDAMDANTLDRGARLLEAFARGEDLEQPVAVRSTRTYDERRGGAR